jgi:AbrB family looped-hinge helix DNA binding protein
MSRAVTVSVDAAGRLLLPRAIREKAGLKPGILFEVVATEGHIEMKPASQGVRLVREGPFKASPELARLALRARTAARDRPPLNTLRHRAPPADDSEPAERVLDVIGERFVELLGTVARRTAVLEPGSTSIKIIGTEGHFVPQVEQGVRELLGLSPRAASYRGFLDRLASEFRDWALAHDRHKIELGIEVSGDGVEIRTPEIKPALEPLGS